MKLSAGFRLGQRSTDDYDDDDGGALDPGKQKIYVNFVGGSSKQNISQMHFDQQGE